MSEETGSVKKRRATVKEVTLYPGMKIRNWTLLEYVVIIKESRQRSKVGAWKVVDDKGVESTIEASELKRFSYRKAMVGAEVSTLNWKYKHYRRSALDRGYPFELSIEKFSELIHKDCDYCGTPPSNGNTYLKRGNDIKYSGVDRVDNAIGYTDDNCVSCCTTCNYAKRERSAEDYRKWLNQITDFTNFKRTQKK